MGDTIERATATSKGQLTIPKAVRRELGMTTGSQVEFRRVGPGRFVIEVADGAAGDPAIASFLKLIEGDIARAGGVRTLSEDTVERWRSLVDGVDADRDEEIGETAL